jgi:hypothetical protein
MSWSVEMVLLERALIHDFAQPYTYSDGRLQNILCVAAQLTRTYELDFDINYTINITQQIISPDPTNLQNTPYPRDDAFINLVSLKAATIILNGELKTYAGQAVILQDGPSKIDLSNLIFAAELRYKEIMKLYEESRVQYMAGNRTGLGIISSMRIEDWPPIHRNLGNLYDGCY